jgi:hypothetical protein
MIQIELNEFQATMVHKALEDYKRKLQEDLDTIRSYNDNELDKDIACQVSETSIALLESSIRETDSVIQLLTR